MYSWVKSTKGYQLRGFPGGPSDKEPTCQCRRCSFDPWVGKMPWRREWQPTLVCMPGESHGQRSLVGDNPWDGKEWTTTKSLNNWSCLVKEFWAEMTFPLRGWGPESPAAESWELSAQTEDQQHPRWWLLLGGGGLIRPPRPSLVGVIWARINFGSFKMPRSGGAIATEQPEACYNLWRAAGKKQDTQFSLDCRWATHNLVG